MRSCLLLIFNLCLLTGISHAALEFEKTELELDSGLTDKEIQVVFRFTNTGDKAVSISEVRSSCGCTVPTLEKKVYQPGDSGEISALFTFGGRTGKQHKTIFLKTDDPENPNVKLSFTTTIPEWCYIEPRILRWQLSQESTSQNITLTITDPERVSVELVEDQFPEAFTFEKVDASSDKIVYSITPLSTDNRLTGKITFRMTGKDGDASDIREGYVYGLIR